MEITKKAILLICILMASLMIIMVPSGVQAGSPSVTQVQTARGESTSSPLSVSLTNAPTSGNVLIAVIGWKTTGGSGIISGINQGDDIAWVLLESSFNLRTKVAVYYAIVPDIGSKPTTLTITITGSGLIAVADVCEYSGLNTAYLENIGYDAAAMAAESGTTLTTGTSDSNQGTPEADSTTFPYELCIGGIILNANGAQTAPTNGFALTDGTVYNGGVNGLISVAYLEKTISSKGTVQTGTTGGASGTWAGVIVTIPIAPTITLVPSSGPTGILVSVTGENFASNSDITAEFGTSSITLSGTPHTNSDGYFIATFTVPTVIPGPYIVTATDEMLYAASAIFMVVIPPVPENPIGVIAPVIAIALAFVAFTAVKRSKGPAKPSISI